MSKKLQLISLDRIKDPERPMRSNLTPESVDDLVFSIKEVGIIQPLVVSPDGDNFEVIAGHRRLLAAEIAKLTEAPCIVVNAKGMNREVLKMHENIAREDISPIDWANHLAYLKEQYKLTNAKLGELTGFSEAWVSQHLEVLNYPAEVIEAIQNGTLAFSSARELAQIKDPVKRGIYVSAAVRSGVTPAQAAQWRKEANLPSYQPTSQEPVAQNEAPVPDVSTTLPICPVCGQAINFEDILTLQIHKGCAPQSEPAATPEE